MRLAALNAPALPIMLPSRSTIKRAIPNARRFSLTIAELGTGTVRMASLKLGGSRWAGGKAAGQVTNGEGLTPSLKSLGRHSARQVRGAYDMMKTAPGQRRYPRRWRKL
jgi:hypothetical protein